MSESKSALREAVEKVVKWLDREIAYSARLADSPKLTLEARDQYRGANGAQVLVAQRIRAALAHPDAPAPPTMPDEPLTEAEREELDAITANMFLASFSERERMIARLAVRWTLKLKRPAPPPRCAPDPFCPCCECQGRMCIMPHPGHSHRGRDWALDRIEFAGRGDRTEPASKATTESVGLEVSDPPAGDFVTGHGQQSSAVPPPASRRDETPKTYCQSRSRDRYICELEAGHDGPHRALTDYNEGRSEIEWAEPQEPRA